MKENDKQFCQDNIINFESVKLGFTRNIPFDVLGEYERMYRDYLDPQFSLTYWCGECVFDMLKRLIVYYELHLKEIIELPDEVVENLEEAEKIIEQEYKVKKRGRPKK